MSGNTAFLNADAAIAWIHGEGNARKPSQKSGLHNIRVLMRRLGDPQNSLRMIHVAGTNGKGSVCAYTERCLREAGYHTGLYTSPYLCRYNERIKYDGISIPDEDLIRLSGRVKRETDALAEKGIYATTFEIGTALAFLYFAEKHVDCAVIEAGIGGRLDSTNIIMPCLSVICSISRDHTSILGDTLTSIAYEKAGIIKDGIPCAVYPIKEEAISVIRTCARLRGSWLLETGSIPTNIQREDMRGSCAEYTLEGFGTITAKIPLVGAHQIRNARLALGGLSLIRHIFPKLDKAAMERGIAATKWPGRLEWTDEQTLIDGAHNPEGASSLAAYINTFLGGRKRILVTGMMKDKQVDVCADILAQTFDNVIATRVDYPRAAGTGDIAALYAKHGCTCLEVPSISKAIERARALMGRDGVTVIAGSLYVAGEARLMLTGGEVL